MATNKTKAAEATENPEETKAAEAEKPADERVEVFIPRSHANDDPNLYVSVNGVNYLLPRGQKSMVPPAVKYEIERSRRAQETRDNHITEMLDASK